jgi:hypothetical protein
MRDSCRRVQCGGRGRSVLDGGAGLRVGIRRGEAGSRARVRWRLGQEGCPYVFLSCLGECLCLRSRSMELGSREVSVEIQGVGLCESHGVSCDFVGRRLRCLRIFG